MSLIALDANFLIALAEPGVELGAAAGELAGDDARFRLEELWARLNKAGVTILIPTPALAEAMVLNPARVSKLLERLIRSPRMKIEPFGSAAAMEAADMFRREFPRRKEGRDIIRKSKLKFDLQIVAIARVAGCDRIYSTDRGLRLCAERAHLRASGLEDLAKPKASQSSLPLPPPAASARPEPEAAPEAPGEAGAPT